MGCSLRMIVSVIFWATPRQAALTADLYADFDPAAIDLLTELAGDGPVLDLCIGTGWIVRNVDWN